MFQKKPNNKLALEAAIAKALLELDKLSPTDPNYEKQLTVIEKLHRIREIKNPNQIDLNDLLAVIGNLAGILAIINFERVGAVTSKALGFVMKSKL